MRDKAYFSIYNRAMARAIGHGAKHDGSNALSVCAMNEAPLLVMIGLLGTGEPYRLMGLDIAPVGAFARPTMKHILRTVKEFL